MATLQGRGAGSLRAHGPSGAGEWGYGGLWPLFREEPEAGGQRGFKEEKVEGCHKRGGRLEGAINIGGKGTAI